MSVFVKAVSELKVEERVIWAVHRTPFEASRAGGERKWIQNLETKRVDMKSEELAEVVNTLIDLESRFSPHSMVHSKARFTAY